MNSRQANRIVPALTRRQMLRSTAAAAGCALVSATGCGGASAGQQTQSAPAWPPDLPVGTFAPSAADETFLDALEQRGCLYFWEQANASNGQVLDHASNALGGALDTSTTESSIAATGFGLTALCIADQRGYLPHAQVVTRVQATLDFHLNSLLQENGFFYHFNDLNSGQPLSDSEVSSIDTAILICGVLTARAYFGDATISTLGTELYERVNWPWMLNGGATFAQAWYPGTGFSSERYDTYCELMMLYLLAIGSPTFPIAPSYWNNFARPLFSYAGHTYMSGGGPLFTHQYSHAWFDFRSQSDAHANYFANSIAATQAHESFCVAYPSVEDALYNEDYWGISSSDYAGGYTAWGGPPALGPIDGSVVPCAAAGSLVFLPNECLAMLEDLQGKWGSQAWGRYGFVDAFHPAANWYNEDVLGIDQGISVLMAENLRSGLVWSTFMSNPECAQAMQLAGFKA